MRWGYDPVLSWVPTWVSRPRAGWEEAQGNADPLPSGGPVGDRALTRRHLAQPLLCLPRELLGGPQAWPLLLASCLVPGVLQLASLPLLPESPRYLFIDCGDSEACLAGESLTLGPQTTFDHGAHLARACGSLFPGSHLFRKSYPSLCASIS